MHLLPISETATNSATNFLSAYCLYSTRHLDFEHRILLRIRFPLDLLKPRAHLGRLLRLGQVIRPPQLPGQPLFLRNPVLLALERPALQQTLDVQPTQTVLHHVATHPVGRVQAGCRGYFVLLDGSAVDVDDLVFGSIGNMTLENYKNAVKDMDEKEIVDDLEEQIHTNSKICSLKAKWYNKGIKFLLVTVILWFVCMIFQLI